ncbi:MAG: hypothetical protein ABIU54_13515 [Candidatus Eisenbacteria bacterium]
MSRPLVKAERDALLARAASIERELYPPEDGPPEPVGAARVRLLDTYYQVLHEYGDRLPRIGISRCPLTMKPLHRSVDPFGLDGPWWHKSCIVEIEEPAPPPTFQLLLGALDLRGRTPVEAQAEIIPGPQAPFAVARLLKLPGMCAVISQLTLEHGDIAHVIAYYSNEPLPQQKLHQHWLRQDLWFPNASGGTSWLTMNDPHDFALAPWIESAQVKWIAPGDNDLVVQTGTAGCPYLGLPGDPHPQMLSGGQRLLLKIPDGGPIDPFEDPGEGVEEPEGAGEGSADDWFE